MSLSRQRIAAIEIRLRFWNYNQKEYTEKYAYELAKLYYHAREGEMLMPAMIWLCGSDRAIWLSALELKQRIKALTPYSRRFMTTATLPCQKSGNGRKMLHRSGKLILEKYAESSKEVITDDVISATEKEIAQSVAEHTAEKEENDDYGIFAAFSENQEKTDQEERDFRKNYHGNDPGKDCR